jgi:hypothetical protein
MVGGDVVGVNRVSVESFATRLRSQRRSQQNAAATEAAGAQIAKEHGRIFRAVR